MSVLPVCHVPRAAHDASRMSQVLKAWALLLFLVSSFTRGCAGEFEDRNSRSLLSTAAARVGCRLETRTATLDSQPTDSKNNRKTLVVITLHSLQADNSTVTSTDV